MPFAIGQTFPPKADVTSTTQGSWRVGAKPSLPQLTLGRKYRLQGNCWQSSYSEGCTVSVRELQ